MEQEIHERLETNNVYATTPHSRSNIRDRLADFAIRPDVCPGSGASDMHNRHGRPAVLPNTFGSNPPQGNAEFAELCDRAARKGTSIYRYMSG